RGWASWTGGERQELARAPETLPRPAPKAKTDPHPEPTPPNSHPPAEPKNAPQSASEAQPPKGVARHRRSAYAHIAIGDIGGLTAGKTTTTAIGDIGGSDGGGAQNGHHLLPTDW